MRTFTRHILAMKVVAIVMAINFSVAMGTVLYAQSQVGNMERHDLSGLQTIISIATGVMLVLEVALFHLYNKLSADVGPMIEAVGGLKKWRDDVANPALMSLADNLADSRHLVRNEVMTSIFQTETRLRDEITEVKERTHRLESHMLENKNGK